MKRATVHFEDDLHAALKLKAAEESVSISQLVNEAIRDALSEDLKDQRAFTDREAEPAIDFESFIQRVKGKGRL